MASYFSYFPSIFWFLFYSILYSTSTSIPTLSSISHKQVHSHSLRMFHVYSDYYTTLSSDYLSSSHSLSPTINSIPSISSHSLILIILMDSVDQTLCYLSILGSLKRSGTFCLSIVGCHCLSLLSHSSPVLQMKHTIYDSLLNHQM